MSSLKARFPGRPRTKNGQHKIRRFSKNQTKTKKTRSKVSTAKIPLSEINPKDFSEELSDDVSFIFWISSFIFCC